jgi:hypothetical protein
MSCTCVISFNKFKNSTTKNEEILGRIKLKKLLHSFGDDFCLYVKVNKLKSH